MSYYGIAIKGKFIVTQNVKEFLNLIYFDKKRKILEKNISFKKTEEKKDILKWIMEKDMVKVEVIKKVERNCIYFDAGTGRGIGTETRVTDYTGKSILNKLNLGKLKVNEYGNINFAEKTNNYGELAGMFLALKLAIKENIKTIAGDSELIIKWWSNGYFKEKALPEKTILLIKETIKLRKEFEKNGGKIYRISGDINPADLGFHKKR